MNLTASRRMRSGAAAEARSATFNPVPIPATAADFAAIVRLLASIFPSSCCGEFTEAEFKASLDDPFHESNDRLILRCGPQLLGHVLTTRRTMQFGPMQIPAAGLQWLGVDAAIRAGGNGSRLLAAAERRMAGQGALIGLMRTRIPRFFHRNGWTLCGRGGRGRAVAHDLIAAMISRGYRPGLRQSVGRPSCEDILRGGRRKRLHVRCWRRVEIPALLRLYKQNTFDSFGPLERTEAYWNWLVDRRGYDRIYVALDGPDLFELDENRTHVVGYAVIRGERILELMVEPSEISGPDPHPAAVELLARACDDCIEQGRNCLEFHGRPQDRLHDLFAAAGGVQPRVACQGGEVQMAKLLRPGRVLHLLTPLFHDRLQAATGGDFANAQLPGRLSLNVDGKRYAILLGSKGAAVQTGRAAEFASLNRVDLNAADFTRLVLGQFDWEAPAGESSLVAATPAALRSLQLLFPPLPLWRPPFDDATAR